jgi:hypothetical protein
MADHRAQSVRRRIIRDRGGAQFFAFLASIPAWAIAVGSIAIAGLSLFGRNDPEDRAGALIIGAVLVVFAWLFTMVARWTFAAVRAALTPQHLQAMWLRRFQSEGGSAFQTSRVIDQLSRYGVSALTLQDRDVQLSWEQRRNRLAPVFWLIFLPVVVALAIGGISAMPSSSEIMENLRPLPQTTNIVEGIAQAFVQALVGAIVWVFIIGLIVFAIVAAAILATLLIMIVASLVGPIGAFLSRGRDDFQRLPRLIQRIRRGKRSRGAQVLRISNENWQDAVRAGLSAANVAIIDLSSVTDNILWEIGEALKACGPDALVFICRQGPKGERAVAAPVLQSVRGALGREPANIVYYPAARGRERAAADFARALREAIYDAADRRQAAAA